MPILNREKLLCGRACVRDGSANARGMNVGEGRGCEGMKEVISNQ